MLQLWRIARALGFKDQGKRSGSLLEKEVSESEVKQCAAILASCARLRDLAKGREIHGYILQSKHCRNVYLFNLLITMYGKCGCVRDALQIFQGMVTKNCYTSNIMIQVLVENEYIAVARDLFESWQERTLISWRIMITAYARSGDLMEAKRLFDAMPQLDVKSWTVVMVGHADNGDVPSAAAMFERMPQWDSVTWSSMIVAYAQAGYLCKGKEMLENSQANCVSWTAIITAYGQYGQIENAKELFDSMPDKDVVAWKAMLTAYAQNGHLVETQRLYERIPVQEANVANFMIVVYAQNGFLDEAETMLQLLVAGGYLNLEACTAMITAYSQAKDLDQARFLYNTMKHRDVTLSTAMIAACGDSGLVHDARDVFDEIVAKDSVAWTTMLDAYARNGYMREALDLFHSMPRKCVIPWSALISGFARSGHLSDSKDLFDRFPRHNVVSATAMLQAYPAALVPVAHAAEDSVGVVDQTGLCVIMVASCFDSSCPGLAFDILDKMPEWENFNAMIVAYAHKGRMDQSRELFLSLEERDTSSWSAMISGYACNGLSTEALESFRCMNQDGVDPDEVTYTSVLNACSHTGMVAASLEQFVAMSSDHSETVEPALGHYHCVVDVLCRAGHLDLAEELIEQMPLEPDCVPWTTLLGGCRTHGDLERGWRVAGRVLEMDPAAAAHYMLLCSIRRQSRQW